MTGRGRTAVHGTPSTYANLGCRCDDCRAAATAARAAWVRSLQDRPASDIPHGTMSGYRDWGCRCHRCQDGRRAARASQPAARARATRPGQTEENRKCDTSS